MRPSGSDEVQLNSVLARSKNIADLKKYKVTQPLYKRAEVYPLGVGGWTLLLSRNLEVLREAVGVAKKSELFMQEIHLRDHRLSVQGRRIKLVVPARTRFLERFLPQELSENTICRGVCESEAFVLIDIHNSGH